MDLPVFEKEATSMQKLGKHNAGKSSLYIKISDVDLKVLGRPIMIG